ncbi:SDR family oxidoreductase [Thiotrichales bacterium 19S11-10]|nr:SDR family oxidoreductase [Thiotrichales bacterium 19S11-10]
MKEKVALITGASSGIGKAVSNYFAKQNYKLILISKTKSKLETVKNEIQTAYPNTIIEAYAIDLSQTHQAYEQLTSIINSLNQLDVVFNNAGIARYGTSETTLYDFDCLLDTNTKGAFIVAKAAALKMKQQKSGYIINLASYAATRQTPRTGSYAASKCALVGFSNALLIELARYHIKVTTLNPSAVNTDMTKDFNIDNEDKLSTCDITNTIDYLLNLGPNAYISTIDIQMRGFASGEFSANNVFDIT